MSLVGAALLSMNVSDGISSRAVGSRGMTHERCSVILHMYMVMVLKDWKQMG